MSKTIDNVVLLRPLFEAREALTIHHTATADVLALKLITKTYKSDTSSWRYTKRNDSIRFFIYSRVDEVATIISEKASHITITSGLILNKLEFYDLRYNSDDLRKEFLKHLLNDLDFKASELFNDAPDIAMSRPDIFSIEISDDDRVKVEIGMFALVNWKQEEDEYEQDKEYDNR